MPLEILRNVGGVQGLHVALDSFDEDVERELFQSAVHGGNDPRSAQRHGTHTNPSDWAASAPEIIKVCNVVKDSGLVPDYLAPDYLFAITYPAGCTGFKEHFDSRYRWGETVVGVTLGREATLYFVPGHQRVKALGVPAAPVQSALGVRAKRYDSGLFAIELSLPRRSIYVMSGAARTDWKHGIRALPRAEANGPLPAAWNPHSLRRALTLRATKVYSDHCLQELLAANPADRSIRARLEAQRKYRPEHGHYSSEAGGKLSDEALVELRERTRERYHTFQQLPLGLRFAAHHLLFPLPAGAAAAAANANAATRRTTASYGLFGGLAGGASGGDGWGALGSGQRLGVGGGSSGGGFGGGFGDGDVLDAHAALEESQLAAAIAASLRDAVAPEPPVPEPPARDPPSKDGGGGSGGGAVDSRLLLRVIAALDGRPECRWPYEAGAGHLGVSLTNSVAANCEELRRRIEEARYFSAAQALHRLTDGLSNVRGPPNGHGRPTLATKWKRHRPPAEAATIDAHVLQLKLWLAPRAQMELGVAGVWTTAGGGDGSRGGAMTSTASTASTAFAATAATATASTATGCGGSASLCGGGAQWDPISLLDDSEESEDEEAEPQRQDGAATLQPAAEAIMAPRGSKRPMEEAVEELAAAAYQEPDDGMMEAERMRRARLRRFGV